MSNRKGRRINKDARRSVTADGYNEKSLSGLRSILNPAYSPSPRNRAERRQKEKMDRVARQPQLR
jgi:hypothetical protein